MKFGRKKNDNAAQGESATNRTQIITGAALSSHWP